MFWDGPGSTEFAPANPEVLSVQLGILSTSWPSSGRPWAGHFVRDLAMELVDADTKVTVVAPQWPREALRSQAFMVSRRTRLSPQTGR